MTLRSALRAVARQARACVFGVAMSTCVAIPGVHAQTAPKAFRIGYIQTATAEEQAHLTQALEDALRQLGYAEGANVVFERRFADGQQELLPSLAADLVRSNVDVIVTGANPVIEAVRQATTTIPIVMATSRDPVGAGFIASLARPGGNITGVTSDPSSEMQGKRLELLLEVLPKAQRVALLWNPAPPGADAARHAIEQAARRSHVAVLPVEARGRGEFGDAFARIARAKVDAVVVVPDPIFFTARRNVVALAARYRLPAIYHAREVVEAGGLMSYGVSLTDQFRRAAAYVDRILKGARPGDLPVEQGSRFELAVNLETARQLGITIPGAIRLRASHVVE